MTLPGNFLDLNDEEKLKLTLNDPLNAKFSSQFILNAFNKRAQFLSKIVSMCLSSGWSRAAK